MKRSESAARRSKLRQKALHPFCRVEHPEDGSICSLEPGHDGLHKAGDGGPSWIALRGAEASRQKLLDAIAEAVKSGNQFEIKFSGVGIRVGEME